MQFTHVLMVVAVAALGCAAMTPTSFPTSFCGVTPYGAPTPNFVANLSLTPRTPTTGSFILETYYSTTCSVTGTYVFEGFNSTFQFKSTGGTCEAGQFGLSSGLLQPSGTSVKLMGYDWNWDGGNWELMADSAQCSDVVPSVNFCGSAFGVAATVEISPGWLFAFLIAGAPPCVIQGRYLLEGSTGVVSYWVNTSTCTPELLVSSVTLVVSPLALNISGSLVGIPWNSLATAAKCGGN